MCVLKEREGILRGDELMVKRRGRGEGEESGAHDRTREKRIVREEGNRKEKREKEKKERERVMCMGRQSMGNDNACHSE
jgi:hypothetical protein